MLSLYGYLQKKQIVYKIINTEKDDGIMLIDNLPHLPHPKGEKKNEI
jgi:hypothetical protein